MLRVLLLCLRTGTKILEKLYKLKDTEFCLNPVHFKCLELGNLVPTSYEVGSRYIDLLKCANMNSTQFSFIYIE